MSDEDLERLGRLGLLMDGLPMDVAGRLLNEFTELAAENERLLHDAINAQETISAVTAENERLRAVVDDNEAIIAAAGMAIRDYQKITKRLRAVVEAADDFWPLVEGIYDEAVRTWEYEDPRMKYVTVQINKVDLPTLRAAYAKQTGGGDVSEDDRRDAAELEAENARLRAVVKAFVSGPAESTATMVSFPVSAVAGLIRALDVSGNIGRPDDAGKP